MGRLFDPKLVADENQRRKVGEKHRTRELYNLIKEAENAGDMALAQKHFNDLTSTIRGEVNNF